MKTLKLLLTFFIVLVLSYVVYFMIDNYNTSELQGSFNVYKQSTHYNQPTENELMNFKMISVFMLVFYGSALMFFLNRISKYLS